MADTTLTDGSPVTKDYKDINSITGQQKEYIVLSNEERSKGFIRLVRTTYRHVGVRPKHPTRPLTDDEKTRYKLCDYVLFEIYPESEDPVTGRFWTRRELHSGCQTITTMHQNIAETYARDPKFYGSTFCCGCGKHLPVAEFVWEGTEERVGS